MKRIFAITLAALFAVSTGAFAASHMKGAKDAKGAKMEKADKKAEPKKGESKK